MGYSFIPDSGFVADNGGPDRNRPRDWIVWHFTHIDNLQAVVSAGGLIASSSVTPTTNVAASEIKARRATKPVQPDPTYPASFVSDHVPFYIAAKSPMLYRVHRGHPEYGGGCDPLVFLGVQLGSIVDAGLQWCASDENASSSLAVFSRDLSTLGTFVDFDLLAQRDWYNTQDDLNRMTRRAAEVLVLHRVPIELVSFVTCKVPATLERAKLILNSVGGNLQYTVNNGIFF